MQASHDRTVLIAGAGIAGPTLAYWLLRRGFRPTLVEAAPKLREGGYMIDFWGVGYDVAEKMGLLAALRAEGYAMTELRLVDGRGRRVGGFDTRAYESVLGGRFFSILRSELSRRIFRTVASDVETIFGDDIAAVAQDDDAVHVTLRRGAVRSFAYLIGADGLHSAVRAAVFGPEQMFEKYLGYYAAAFAIARYPHRDESVYVSYAAPGRQVARYALRDGRTAFFFVVARPRALDNSLHDRAAQARLLRALFRDDDWEAGEILAAMDAADELYFDAVSQIRMPRWSSGRVALIGDAASCPSLLAGQGAAFAMAQAYLLAGELQRAKGDFRLAFANFERAFRPFLVGKQKTAASFGKWFAPRTRIGLAARNAVTGLMSMPSVGDWLIGRMLGDRFALPDYES